MDYSNIGTNEDNTFLILMSTLPIDIKVLHSLNVKISTKLLDI
jgi:hypothetical protein